MLFVVHRILATALVGSTLLPWQVPVDSGAGRSPIVAGAVRAAPDSSELRSRARDAQAAFERARIRYAPRTFQSFGGTCDERIGRMCIRLMQGTGDGWTPPPEDPRVVDARGELLAILDSVGEAIPGDPWVLGQRVAYLGEAEEWPRARELARGCPLGGEWEWWCLSLEGLAAHFSGDFVSSERAFADAMEGMPEDVLEEWRELTPIMEIGLHRHFRNADPDSFAVLEARLWRLADPLYLVSGNDHRTEHLARHVLARIRSQARNPYAMQWGGDLTEILVRYGPEVAFQQQTIPPMYMGPTPVVGRFNPRSRGFLPLEDQFIAPSTIEQGAWRTDERGVRARHAPSYAPRIGALDVQQARFRRGDDLFLVLGWEIADGEPAWAEPGEADDGSVEGSRVGAGAYEAGLFLLSEPELDFVDGPMIVQEFQAHGTPPRGVASGRVPAGGYLVSLELLDAPGERAWRARHGVRLDSIPSEVVILSDLLLLEPERAVDHGRPAPSGAPPDPSQPSERLEAHLARVHAGGAVTEDLVEVAWEVYGLTGNEGPLTFRLSATPEDRGLLRRAGELLRLLDPESSVEVSWQEGARPDSPGAPLFRRVEMDLSALPAGRVRLALTLELPGRTGTTTDLVLERLD